MLGLEHRDLGDVRRARGPARSPARRAGSVSSASWYCLPAAPRGRFPDQRIATDPLERQRGLQRTVLRAERGERRGAEGLRAHGVAREVAGLGAAPQHVDVLAARHAARVLETVPEIECMLEVLGGLGRRMRRLRDVGCRSEAGRAR